MARPLEELQSLVKGLAGVKQAYIQPPTSGMEFPCIIIEQGLLSNVSYASNQKYHNKKGYTITVVDRDPYSLIPDLVDGLEYTEFNRFFKTNNVNHFVFQMFF